MYRSSFGIQGQISFSNENEYYELLGYLAKSDGTTALTWEHNEDQGVHYPKTSNNFLNFLI